MPFGIRLSIAVLVVILLMAGAISGFCLGRPLSEAIHPAPYHQLPH
jgi:hypothetical protein